MVVNQKLFKKIKTKTQESKQKQFHVHNHVRNSYKTCKSTLLCIGNSEENIDLSCIYLAVHQNNNIGKTKHSEFVTEFGEQRMVKSLYHSLFTKFFTKERPENLCSSKC